MHAQDRKEQIPESFATAEEAGEFWDSHDLGDFWDQTEESDVTIELLRNRFLISLDPDLAGYLHAAAQKKGISAEKLANMWLRERAPADLASG